MFETLMYIVLTAIVIVIAYHWIDKDNFYAALVESKDTAKYVAITSKEVAKTSKKGFQTSKAVYNATEMEHKASFAKAGKDYDKERASKDEAMTKSIQSVFTPINESLDNTKKEAEESIAKSQAMLDAL